MLSTSAERDILSVISEYHQNIVPLIDSYVQSAVTSKRVFLSTPAYKIRRVISDEIKNAADHLGRASVADTDARAFEQTAMARWHMDQVKILALISLNGDLRRDITWLSKKKRTTRFIDKPLFLQVTKDHDVILEKIRTWADDLKALRRQNRSPTSDEIDRTRLLANDIEAIHVRYTRLIGTLQANVRRIFIVELNIYRRLKVKKEVIVAVGALLLAIASSLCGRKIQAASAPDDPSLLAIVMSIAALLLTGISTIAWVTVGRLAFDWIMKKRT